jgi:hypothetical protein
MKRVCIIEKTNKGYDIYLKSQDLLSSNGKNISEAIENFQIAIKEYSEYCDSIGIASSIDSKKLEFEYRFSLETFFDHYDFINVSKLAEKIGINKSLMRRYKLGNAYASKARLLKIEEEIHCIGEELLNVNLYS